MDLTTLRTAVRTRLGVPSTDGFFSDAQLTDVINEALAALTTEFDWPWLTVITTFATVAGTSTYTPPAGWVRTRALTIDGYGSMQQRSLEEIREYPTTSRGVPTVFCVQDDDLLLRPVPDAVYTVTHDYVKAETALSANGDTPSMPTQFHYAIVAYATHLAHLRAGNLQKGAAALADYQGWLRRMANDRRRASGPLRIRVRPGGYF